MAEKKVKLEKGENKEKVKEVKSVKKREKKVKENPTKKISSKNVQQISESKKQNQERIEKEKEKVEKTLAENVEKNTEKKEKYSIEEAIKKLREEKKRNFVQTVDLIINLQKIDIRKQPINTFIQLPYAIEKRIAAFLTKKIGGVECILKEQFDSFKTNRDIRKLARKYDMFIAHASLMKDIAAKFGRTLGPSGKMPSPQLGVILKEDGETIKEVVDKMNKSIRVRTKERSIKIPIGKENMSDEQLKENFESALKSITEILPLKKDNIKNVLIKLTMSKPYEIKK